VICICAKVICLVSRDGRVYPYYDLNKIRGWEDLEIDISGCLRYIFNLRSRKFHLFMRVFRPKSLHREAARKFFDERINTPQKLMKYVDSGQWDEDVLESLLAAPALERYRKVQPAVETAYSHRRCEQLKRFKVALKRADKARDKFLRQNKARLVEVIEVEDADYFGKEEVITTRDLTAIKAGNLRNNMVNAAYRELDKSGENASEAAEEKLKSVWLKLFSDPRNRIPIWRS